MRKTAGNYRYDPTHTHKPKDGIWDETDRGWSRRKSPPQKGTEAVSNSVRPLAVVALPPPSKPLRRRLAAFARSKYRGFYNHGMTKFEEASAEVDALMGDQRAMNRDLNHLFRAYADHEMQEVVPELSTHIARFYGVDNLDTDFRTKGVRNLPASPPKLLSRLGDLLSYEQAVIRAAGLVNPDETVTLFRNCGANQLAGPTKTGRKYQGSNVESWTVNPSLDWPGFKIKANIPIKYCIASCIGRKDHPFKHPDQSEITVCGTFVEEITLLEEANRNEAIKQDAIHTLRRNMLRRISDGGKRKASRIAKSTLKLVKSALLSLVAKLLCNNFSSDGVYYGERSILECSNCVANGRPMMANGKAKEITAKKGRMPSQGEIDFQLQMKRWTEFVRKRGFSVAGGMTRAVRNRLWEEFVVLERKRNPNVEIPEWHD